MADSERRRRRLRHDSPGSGFGPADRAEGTTGDRSDREHGRSSEHGRPGSGRSTEPVTSPEPEPAGWAGSRRAPGNGAKVEERDGERGLRGLIGSGASQVSIGAALRARDAARPTEADLAEAANHLLIVRRNWVPREELPRHSR